MALGQVVSHKNNPPLTLKTKTAFHTTTPARRKNQTSLRPKPEPLLENPLPCDKKPGALLPATTVTRWGKSLTERPTNPRQLPLKSEVADRTTTAVKKAEVGFQRAVARPVPTRPAVKCSPHSRRKNQPPPTYPENRDRFPQNRCPAT